MVFLNRIISNLFAIYFKTSILIETTYRTLLRILPLSIIKSSSVFFPHAVTPNINNAPIRKIKTYFFSSLFSPLTRIDLTLTSYNNLFTYLFRFLFLYNFLLILGYYLSDEYFDFCFYLQLYKIRCNIPIWVTLKKTINLYPTVFSHIF